MTICCLLPRLTTGTGICYKFISLGIFHHRTYEKKTKMFLFMYKLSKKEKLFFKKFEFFHSVHTFVMILLHNFNFFVPLFLNISNGRSQGHG